MLITRCTSNRFGVLKTSHKDPLDTNSVTIALLGGSMQAAMYRHMLGCLRLASISTSSTKALRRAVVRLVWHIADST